MNNKIKHAIVILLLLLTGCTSVPSQDKTSAGLNVQLGVGYMQQGQMERAKQKLLLALKQAANWPPALDAMALYAEKTGDIETARKYYQRSLEIAPNDGSVQNNYGAFLCRTGQPKQAEAHFLRAVQDPQYLHVADAYENAGLCALKIPDRKLARMYFQKALLHSPGREKTLQELRNLDSEEW